MPSPMTIVLSVITKFVVSTNVVAPSTVKLPVRVKLLNLTFDEIETS